MNIAAILPPFQQYTDILNGRFCLTFIVPYLRLSKCKTPGEESLDRMEGSGKEEYKIQSFDMETQKLLKTALKGE